MLWRARSDTRMCSFLCSQVKPRRRERMAGVGNVAKNQVSSRRPKGTGALVGAKGNTGLPTE